MVSEARMTSSILSSDLCLVASQAAIELDNIILGKKKNLKAVRKLAGILKENLGSSSATHSVSAVPGTLTLVGNAMNTSEYGPPAKTVAALIDEAANVVENLETSASKGSRDQEDLPKLREFCAALSLCSASYLQGMYASRPSHPFRR
jgi:hypothetical protein